MSANRRPSIKGRRSSRPSRWRGVQVGKYHGRAPVEDDERLLAPHHKAADAQC